MAVAWTDITNAQVAAGAALTTALMTALRDNPEGIAQRAVGAPKIFGVPYDYQEFTANGTWTKPSNAESGDRVIIQIVGGGGSGTRASAGAGGGGAGGEIKEIENIASLGATEAVSIGAGAAGVTGTSGGTGGNSSFGANKDLWHIRATGGVGASGSTGGSGGFTNLMQSSGNGTENIGASSGGTGGNGPLNAGTSSLFGGGGGGAIGNTSTTFGVGGASSKAGHGGTGSTFSGTLASTGLPYNGVFPGGGGGGISTSLSDDTVSGAGANGVVRVWCIKEG